MNCPRFGKLWNGCRFEARYDTGPVRIGTIDTSRSAAAIIRAAAPLKYVHDVCIRCGRTIERPSDTRQDEGGEK